MKITPIFAWYDFWIGWFWDAKKRRLYIFPVPMFGFYVTIYGKRCWVLMKRGYFWRPEGKGYTAHIGEAWLLTEQQAEEYHDPRIPLGDDRTTMRHIKDFL